VGWATSAASDWQPTVPVAYASESMASQPTATRSAPDVQASVPATQVSLSRVGVTGVEKVIRVKSNGSENLFYAGFECFVDLNPRQAGVHMSRFEEIVGEAIDEVVLGEAFKAEVLAAHVAQRVRERQGGERAEVSVTARYPETALTPETGKSTQEIYVLYGTAVDSERGTRTLTGVEAQGMTACPCAQEMVAGLARERLAERGFGEEEVERVIETVPIATHNQRGIGTLHIGCPEGGPAWIEAPELLRIVESSMSSEIYELMKRTDEMAVVVKAHEQPRFVEDCVREMVRQVVEGYPDLPTEAFVMARQENLETIHRHNVVAERHGTLGELRAELAGGDPSPRQMTMREWLETPGA
jgi:GTP cyclohydrolase IV